MVLEVIVAVVVVVIIIIVVLGGDRRSTCSWLLLLRREADAASLCRFILQSIQMITRSRCRSCNEPENLLLVIIVVDDCPPKVNNNNNNMFFLLTMMMAHTRENFLGCGYSRVLVVNISRTILKIWVAVLSSLFLFKGAWSDEQPSLLLLLLL